jgi:hypothetical protein
MSNQKTKVMKKYAILLGLAVVATGAMAQFQNATLGQYGNMNAAKIQQIGFVNGADVLQVGFYNGAKVEQKGAFEFAKVEQFGALNYASLKQDGWFITGTIKQYGFHNLAKISQESYSYANVLQVGNFNIAAEVSRVRFSCWQPCYADWCFNRCDLSLKSRTSYHSIELGKGDFFSLTQFGDGNRLFTNGELHGMQTISQKGYKNFIYLEQKGGVSDLRQKGAFNMIWLKMGKYADNAKISQYGHANRVALDQQDGDSWIYQRGAFNSIAYYGHGICDNCPTDLATFKGDDLKVVQIGVNNRLNLKSESYGSNVTVTQWGNSNYGTVTQANYGSNPNGPCRGCH